MRYAQFLIPALIVIVVTLVLARNRGNPPAPPATAAPADTGGLSTGTFVLILVIGAVFTVALIYALHDSNAS